MRSLSLILVLALAACRPADDRAWPGDSGPARATKATSAESTGLSSPVPLLAGSANEAPPALATSERQGDRFGPAVPDVLRDGTYKTSGFLKHKSGAMVIVEHKSAGRVRFQGYAQWVFPTSGAVAAAATTVAEIDGEADVKGDRFEHESGGCRVIFIAEDPTRIRADEVGDAPCGGLNATFAWSDYRRMGPARFE
jgi:hypothetical protein